MASIDQLKASDGSGNASLATVQSSRSSGSTTIVVDTVSGINPTGFMGSMGTPHTFSDPITSETITVISEATAVDFAGHVDGVNLVIDAIAPGYVDGGSEVGDIVVIRPTTQWGDNVAAVLEVAHNDAGTLKNNAVTTGAIADDAVTAPKLVGIDKSNLTTDSNPYKFSAQRNGALTATANAWTQLVYDAEEFDTNSNFSTSTGKYTAPVSGFYQFNATMTVATNSTTIIGMALYKNGSLKRRGAHLDYTSGNNSTSFSMSALVQLVAGDDVEVYYYSNGAGAFTTGAEYNSFQGSLVSRT